jgi:predicted AlkP superfamily phosphohydrolase/phosphomutase
MTRSAPGGPGRRLPRSLEGQVGCDWNRTVAFAPFGQLSGCVFLNPALTANESVAARVRREVVEILRDARDPETGVPLFRDAFEVADRYDVDPSAEGLPEVLAPSADGYQAQAKWRVSVRNELTRPDPTLPGTHWMDGIIAIDAPDVRTGGHLRANLQDIAPTALAMLGLRVPEGMQGRVLHEAFENALPVRFGGQPVIEEDPQFETLLAAGFGAECA